MALFNISSAPFAISPVVPQLCVGNIWRQYFSDTIRSGFRGGSITQWHQERNSQSEHLYSQVSCWTCFFCWGYHSLSPKPAKLKSSFLEFLYSWLRSVWYILYSGTLLIFLLRNTQGSFNLVLTNDNKLNFKIFQFLSKWSGCGPKPVSIQEIFGQCS